MDYIEEAQKNYAASQRANDTLKKLILELGTRQDNFHVGSGLGGNPSQWWFLVNHEVKAIPTEDQNPSWDRVGTEEILLYVPEKFTMKQIRAALTEFYEKHPHRLDVNDQQVIEPAFLRDQPIRHVDAKIYTLAVESALELQKWLDLKIELNNEIHKVTSKERDVFRAAFLQEMKLPATYFEDHSDDEDDPIEGMYEKHPVWGVKDAAVGARYKAMFDQLLSQEDRDRITFIGSCPSYVTLAAFRRIIGIERMVHLNLDEIKETGFLRTINKAVDEIKA